MNRDDVARELGELFGEGCRLAPTEDEPSTPTGVEWSVNGYTISVWEDCSVPLMVASKDRDYNGPLPETPAALHALLRSIGAPMPERRKADDTTSKTGVDWGSACGRYYLSVDGYVVAMQTDTCRDPDLCEMFHSNTWTDEMIKHVASRATDRR